MKKLRLKDKVLNIIIVILIIVVFLLLFVLFFYDYYADKNGLEKFLNIKLNGSKEIVLNYKDKYTDKGAKATYKGKNITKNIKVSNNLDTTHIGNYKYTYTIKYKKVSKSIIRKVKVVDKNKPSIELNGEKEITIYKGSEYKEPGFKANDDYDGDITSKVKVDSNVDINKIGDYKIIYSIKDSSGNENSVERIIKVIEKKEEPKTVMGGKYIGKTSKGFTIEQKDGIYYIGGVLIANKSYSLPKDYNPGGLLKEFKDNFDKMKSAASKESVKLEVISGFRSYTKQTNTYNRYVSQDGKAKADTYSARPGHSEHQSGLAADINSLSQSWGDTKEGKWLNNNCYKYGFIIRYVKGKDNITGYMYEPWHIRYVGVELATKLYNNGSWITLEEYLGIDSKY